MIFAQTAPKYWAAKLPVVPLLPREKRPAIKRWHQFCDRMPTPEEQTEWLAAYPDGNIGLPLGSCSGLIAIDIDSDDPKVIAAIQSVLPPSPWKRVGRKGLVLLYRYNGIQTVRIRDENDKTVCEILSRGTQIVIPPSIHPDTGKPYWSDVDLADVARGLQTGRTA